MSAAVSSSGPGPSTGPTVSVQVDTASRTSDVNSTPAAALSPTRSSRKICEVKARAMFDRYDKDRSGEIDSKELQDVLQQETCDDWGSVKWTDEEITAMMNAVDESRSGRVSYEQFRHMLEMMVQLDRSQAGAIGRRDVEIALQKCGIHPTQAEIDRLFALADKDGNGAIDLHEFWRLYASLPVNVRRALVEQQDSRQEALELTRHWYRSACTMVSANLRFQIDTPHANITPTIDFVAGSCAGAAGLLVFHPFDTVKVRLQNNDTANLFRGLYRGLSSPMLNVPLVNAVVFASYGVAKRFLESTHTDGSPLTTAEVAMAGGFAGMTNSCIVGPVELIKCRLQTGLPTAPLISAAALRDVSTSPTGSSGPLSRAFSSAAAAQLPAAGSNAGRAFNSAGTVSPLCTARAGPIDVIRDILRKDGYRGLGRGMFATVCRETPCYVGQFASYEWAKSLLSAQPLLSSVALTPSQRDSLRTVLAGGISGIFCWLLSYPQDVIKTRIQTQPANAFPRSRWIPDGGFFSCARQIWRSEGVRGYWKGFSPVLLSAFPVNACGFLAYEGVVKLLVSQSDSSQSSRLS